MYPKYILINTQGTELNITKNCTSSVKYFNNKFIFDEVSRFTFLCVISIESMVL